MDKPISEPEFCPNPSCRFHSRENAAEYQWYIRFGRFQTETRGAIQRFRCRGCGKTCSTQTFSVHYWTDSAYEPTASRYSPTRVRRSDPESYRSTSSRRLPGQTASA